MELEDVDLKSSIKEDTSWLEQKALSHQLGKFTDFGNTERIALSCNLLNFRFMHVAKFENTKFLDVVTGSEDVGPLNIDVKDEDEKCPQFIPIASKDGENS